MFKIKADRECWITVTLPDPDGASKVRLKVRMIGHRENARLKYDRFAEQVAKLRSDVEGGGVESASALLAKLSVLLGSLSEDAVDKDLEAIVSRVTDWADIGDETGVALPFSPEHLRAFLGIATWLVKTVRDAITDFDDNGRQKNS